MLAVDAVQQANSGHPGLPMEAAPIAYVLWTRLMRYNPRNPDWPNRDRFVLSGGHGSMLLYAMLHLTGYDLSLDEIRNFRQWESLTPGHPEYGETPGVETTTGPLGQGIGTAVGMAMAEAHLAARFNTPGHEIVNHYTYVIASDGDMMEGVASEACSLAGHLGLGRLIVIYLDNQITIDGATDLAFSENTGLRFDAYGWHVQRVMDGNDLARVEAAVEMARKRDRPALHHRVPHGHRLWQAPTRPARPRPTESPSARRRWNLPSGTSAGPSEPKFFVPDEVREYFQQTILYGRGWELAWNQTCRGLRGRLSKTRGVLATGHGWRTAIQLGRKSADFCSGPGTHGYEAGVGRDRQRPVQAHSGIAGRFGGPGRVKQHDGGSGIGFLG